MEDKDHSAHGEASRRATHESHYGRLGLMTALSFVAMYVLMYAMVNTLGNVYMNFNQAYMAGLMAAPMVLIELVLMRSMYRNQRLNGAIAAGAVVVAVVLFFFIRRQTAIGDREFLRSMIPHHASAILMCQQASIEGTDIERLCAGPGGILESQQGEIDQMKAMLKARAK